MKLHYVGEVEVDPRRRITLGRAGNPQHKRYRVDEDEVGVLVLTPVASVPISMMDEELRSALDQIEAGDGHPRPDATRL